MEHEFDFNDDLETTLPDFELNEGGGIKSCSDCSDCSDCSECSEKEPEYIDNINDGSHIKTTIMIASAKGGIGRTTITCALAQQLVRAGFSVGILDCDLSASAVSLMYGVNERPEIDESGIHPVITASGVKLISLPLFTGDQTLPMLFEAEEAKEFAVQFYSDVVWGRLDFLLIDTPADTADVISEMIMIRALDGMLVVTDKTRLAGVMARRSIKYSWINRLNVLGLIENRADESENGDAQALSDEYELPILDRIPILPELAKLCDSGAMSEFEGEILPETVKLLISLGNKEEEN